MIERRGYAREIVIAVVAIAVIVALRYFSDSRVLSDYVVRLSAFGIFATSLNILVGYGGMVSFGHAMFLSGGAYVFGLLLQNTGVPIPVALLAAVVFCGLLALVFGSICVRSEGIYFSFLTLAFSMFVYSIILSWISLTGGDQGLRGGIPRPVFFGIDLARETHLYLFSGIAAVVCILLIWLVMQSPFGYTLRMVRDNPDRARFLGIDVWRTRLYAFVISGAFAGVSGVIMALFTSGAYPEWANWTMSGEVIFMLLLGGMGVFVGPVVGAALLLLFNDVITRYTEFHGLAMGIVILVVAMGFRHGVTDFVLRLVHRGRAGAMQPAREERAT